MDLRERARLHRFFCTAAFLAAGLWFAAPARGQITIQPITTRPCLLSGPEDVADIKARLAVHAHPLEALFQTYLYGGTATQMQAASDGFFNGLPATYLGEKGRRLVEDLMRFDIAVALNYASAAQQQTMLDRATEYIQANFGATPANFPALGVNNGNLWLENVIALGVAAMDFPNAPDAQAWITQSVAYLDYEIGVEFLDGYAREQPRYHAWELLQLSNYLAVLKRRCGVDRYDNPVLKQALDWYARYATPRLSIAGTEPVTPAWGDSTYSELGGLSGAPTEAIQLKNFYVTALFAPAYQQRDPYFSRRLMYWWRRGGSPDYTQQDFALTNPQLLDARLPDSPQAARGSHYAPTLGTAILRVGTETDDEMTATFICGKGGLSHENVDNGHIDLFAFGVPLALDSASGPYDPDPTASTWNNHIFAHNTVRFEGQEPTTKEVSGATLNAFGSSEIADYVSGNTKYGTTSVRRVVFVKPDYLVVWDQCVAANFSDFWLHTPAQTLEWLDHKVVSHTPWGVDLDVDFLLPPGTLPAPTLAAANPTSDYTTRNTIASQVPAPAGPALYTTQGEGRFGEWTNPNDNGIERNPFGFKRQAFFSVRAPTANGHYLTVWHPRKTGVTPALTATLTSSSSTGVALTVAFNGRTDTIAIDTAGATVTKGGAGTVQFAETFPQSGVSGAAAYVKTSYGTLTLNNALTTTGPVEVTMGTLALGAANRIPDTAPLRVRLGGTFDLAGYSDTVGDLLLDGGTLTGAGALNVANVEIWGGAQSAAVSASGAFHKKGATPWTLANLTYAGGTFIDGGTLTVNSALPGTRAVQLAAGAVLNLNTALTLPVGTSSRWDGSITGSGSLVNNGTLQLAGTGTLPATMSFTNNGTLDLTLWSGTLPPYPTFVNNGTIIGDSISPTIAAPAAGFTPLTIVTPAGGTTAQLPDYTTQAVTGDNVGVTGVTQSPAINSPQAPGTVHVTLTAHDAAGNAASTGFDVTVLPGPPSIGTQPQGQSIAAGRNAQFSVTASGFGTLTYQWLFNGLAITDGGNISGATTATLTITGAVAADAGSYTVAVSNAGGSVTSSAASLGVDATAPTGTVVSDPFTDGNRSNGTGGDLLGVPFFTQSGTASVASDAVIGTGNALLSPSASTSKVIAEFNPVTLTKIGDFVQLQFDFRFSAAPASINAGLRFGLYQTFGTHTTADAQLTTRTDDVGYGAFTDPGGTTNLTKVYAEGAGDEILTGSGATGLSTFGTTGASSALGTTKHTAKLVLTLQAGGVLQVSGSIDGVAATGTKNPTLLTTSFNELAISSNTSTANSFYLDNLTVTTNNAPRITISSPTSGIVWSTPAASLALSGAASDDAAVTQVTWVNDRGGSGTASGTSAWSISAVPLAVGVNVITVTAGNAAGYSGAATLTVTRTQPGTLQFSSAASQLNESAGSATFTVTRTGGSDGAVSVAWATSNGTAMAGVDYTAGSGTLNWAGGDASAKTFSVPLLPGPTTSGDTAFNVALSAPANGATLGTAATAALTIHHTPTDHWRFAHFGANANAAMAGDLANPSGDGIVNLLKYALNLDPASSAPAGLPSVTSDGAWFYLTYTRVLANTDVTYHPEWSDDFQTWSTTGLTESMLPGSGPTRQMQAKIPVSNAPRFMHLKITRP
ncbi:MAG TPA: Calx-beta domain-containing protein [Chthoniobacteraceae bacterium]|jgi:autotransporter-associated beta strand protein|nr:Calx-beta domain-containing protein [Chthoniobacteraceae bacterium]